MKGFGMLIDTHAHLDRYGEDLEIALEQINQHRIFTISNSIDLPSYERNLEIAERCQLVLPTFGIHPWNASKYVDHLENLHNTINQSPMIGEIGLDYYFIRDASRYPDQIRVLEFFLALATQQDKIISLHTKGAEDNVLHLLCQYNVQRAIIHWYSGSIKTLQDMVKHGFYFTVGIEVLHSPHIQKIAQTLPSELLLTETDNPGGQSWLTDTQGMPNLIIDVVRKLAELRRSTAQVIIETVQANLMRLISDDPWLSDIRNRVFS